MKQLLFCLFIFAGFALTHTTIAAGLATPGYGGLANRFTPQAQAPSYLQSTANAVNQVLDPALVFGNSSFTICAWVSPSATFVSGNGNFFKSNNSSWVMAYYSAQNPTPFLYGVNNVGEFKVSGPQATANSWHLECGGQNSTGPVKELSVDGAAFSTSALSSPQATTTFGGLLMIGGGGGADGAITRLGIWNKVLSSAELTTLYNKGKPLNGSDLTGSLLTGLMHYWDVDNNMVQSNFDYASSSPLVSSLAGFGSSSAGDSKATSTPAPGQGTNRSAYNILPLIPANTFPLYQISFQGSNHNKQLNISGDSLYNGLSQLGYSQTIPGQLSAQLGGKWFYNITSESGQQTAGILASTRNNLENSYCAMTVYNKNVYSLAIGTNDIDSGISTSTIETNIASIISQRKAAGCTTIMITMTPCQHVACSGISGGQSAWNANRASLISWELSGATPTGITGVYTGGGSGADYTIDAGSDSTMSDPTDTHFYADKLHYAIYGATIQMKYLYSLLKTF